MATHRGWQITLDTYTVSGGRTSETFTRIRAPFVSQDGFRFNVYSRTAVSSVGLFVEGATDVVIGDPVFDKRFVITTSSEASVRQLLADSTIRVALELERDVHLETFAIGDRARPTRSGQRDELHFQTRGVVRDIVRLKRLLWLFGAVLDGLARIGSVSPPSESEGPVDALQSAGPPAAVAGPATQTATEQRDSLNFEPNLTARAARWYDPLLARRPQEVRWLRWFRRSLIVCSLFGLIAVSAVTNVSSGPPLAAQYGPWALMCVLEAAASLGFAWYLARWRRVPTWIRIVGIVVLGLFTVGILAVGVGYLLGTPIS